MLVAGNLRDSEELMPHLLLQLLAVLAYLPPHSAFLSLYESGSSDSTGAPCFAAFVKLVRARASGGDAEAMAHGACRN